MWSCHDELVNKSDRKSRRTWQSTSLEQISTLKMHFNCRIRRPAGREPTKNPNLLEDLTFEDYVTFELFDYEALTDS